MSEISESLAAQAGLINELTMTGLEPVMAAEGITPTTFDLLSTIRATGNRAHQADVARRLGVSPATLTSAIQRAVAAGLLVQEDGHRDARTKRVKLTPKANAVLKKVLKAIDVLDAIMKEGIDPEHLQITQEVLRRAAINLAKATMSEEG
jgi:MarR family transcriptional regulator, transcriptional regulator for hemolysin